MAGEPWYGNGLRFGCQRCGHCCGGSPGTIRVSEDEIEALAQRLEMHDAEFRSVYTRRLRGGDVSLRERSDGACVFFDSGAGCRVYEQRPRQCRTWPFWRSVVHSAERWAEEAESCPGMNQGSLHHPELIARTSANDGTSGSVPRTMSAGRRPAGEPA